MISTVIGIQNKSISHKFLLYDDPKITIPNNAKKIICNHFERVFENFILHQVMQVEN